MFGGVESLYAYMVNLGSGESFDLEVVSSRWGFGLGGSGGAVAVLGFGFTEPYELHGRRSNDWGRQSCIHRKIDLEIGDAITRVR